MIPFENDESKWTFSLRSELHLDKIRWTCEALEKHRRNKLPKNSSELFPVLTFEDDVEECRRGRHLSFYMTSSSFHFPRVSSCTLNITSALLFFFLWSLSATFPVKSNDNAIFCYLFWNLITILVLTALSITRFAIMRFVQPERNFHLDL